MVTYMRRICNSPMTGDTHRLAAGQQPRFPRGTASRRGAGTRHRNARRGAAKAHRLNHVAPFGQRHGKAAVEGIARPRRLDHRPGADHRHMHRCRPVVVKRALAAQRDHHRPHTARQQRIAAASPRPPRSRQPVSASASDSFGVTIVAQRQHRIVQQGPPGRGSGSSARPPPARSPARGGPQGSAVPTGSRRPSPAFDQIGLRLDISTDTRPAAPGATMIALLPVAPR
jgi:hypothetical protein